MRRTESTARARMPVVDYSAARAKAIEWLGDRYLLAKPINRIAYTHPVCHGPPAHRVSSRRD
jgi:hypothetical protein